MIDAAAATDDNSLVISKRRGAPVASQDPAETFVDGIGFAAFGVHDKGHAKSRVFPPQSPLERFDPAGGGGLDPANFHETFSKRRRDGSGNHSDGSIVTFGEFPDFNPFAAEALGGQQHLQVIVNRESQPAITGDPDTFLRILFAHGEKSHWRRTL